MSGSAAPDADGPAAAAPDTGGPAAADGPDVGGPAAAAPDQRVVELVAALEEKADPSRADAMAAYMRHQFEFLGLAAPLRRKLAKEFTDSFAGCTQDELFTAVEQLWRLGPRELVYVGTDLLRTHWRVLEPDSLPRLRSLVLDRSWWDSVDPLAHVIGVLVLNHRELADEMDRWIEDDNRWIVRVALLHQLSWKGATDTERLFGYCRRRGGDEDFFIRKAIGWALRDFAHTHPEDVRDFVARHGDELSSMSVSEATKNLPKN
jgi:3-methyladenine DNA glycosylase AlkD